MQINSFELTRLFTSMQLLLVFLVLLFYKSSGMRHRVLALFLLGQTSYILCGVFYGFQTYFDQSVIYLFYFLYSLSYLLGPALYFYVKFISDKSFTFQPKHGLHFLVFFVFLIFNVFFLHIPSTDIYLFSDNLTPGIFESLAIALLHAQILAYLIFSIKILNIHRNNLTKRLYSPSQEKRITWVHFLLISFLIIWLLESLIFFTYSYFFLFLCEIKIVLAVLQFIVANLIVIQGLRKPEILNGDTPKLKYEKNLLSDEERNRYLKQLLNYMDSEKPYLNPSLTLNSLSENTSIPTHHISQLLNTELNKSFYDFVNSYRVEFSKELLISNGSSQKNISEIMYESGFSSKSAFNNAFKKATRLTPKEFRNKNLPK